MLKNVFRGVYVFSFFIRVFSKVWLFIGEVEGRFVGSLCDGIMYFVFFVFVSRLMFYFLGL